MPKPNTTSTRAVELNLTLIPLPPQAYDLTAQAMFLAQQLKANGYGELAALLAKEELAARVAARGTRPRKYQLKGVKGKSGAFWR